MVAASLDNDPNNLADCDVPCSKLRCPVKRPTLSQQMPLKADKPLVGATK